LKTVFRRTELISVLYTTVVSYLMKRINDTPLSGKIVESCVIETIKGHFCVTNVYNKFSLPTPKTSQKIAIMFITQSRLTDR